MKNIKYILLVIVLSTLSCSRDFIDIAPETTLNTSNFFKTTDDFQQALVGVYQPLRSIVSPSGWLMGESRSDNTTYDYNTNSRAITITDREAVSDFLDDETNTETKPKYVQNYIGIARANAILDRLADASIPAADKATINGQTRFLRAFYYFDLVQFYGKVPLHLREVLKPEDAFLPRSPVEEVYKVIISDLQDAINSFPPTVSFPQTGRATVGSAKMLLANVYMVQKKWADAEILLRSITQMGYDLLPEYAAVYALNNKNSRESLFEVQYKEGSADGQFSNFIYFFLPAMANTTLITGTNTSTLSSGFNVPTKDLMNSYEANDKRLDASIGVIEGNFNATGVFVPSALKSSVGYITPAGKVAKFFVKKYLHGPHATANQSGDNWPIYRYAEVLLSLAECLNEQGKASEALPHLNKVRKRANLTETKETDPTLLRDIIAHERRIELAFENKRWLDLVRTGKAITVMTKFGAEMKLQDSRIPATAYNVTPERLLFPIPRSERQVNKLIDQNPGYF